MGKGTRLEDCKRRDVIQTSVSAQHGFCLIHQKDLWLQVNIHLTCIEVHNQTTSNGMEWKCIQTNSLTEQISSDRIICHWLIEVNHFQPAKEYVDTSLSILIHLRFDYIMMAMQGKCNWDTSSRISLIWFGPQDFMLDLMDEMNHQICRQKNRQV